LSPAAITLALAAVSLSACAVISARQPYRTADGAEILITSTMRGGKLAIYINGKPVIEDSIINFGKPMKGTWSTSEVTALCKHKSHWFSTEDECDVFIDGKFAANLYMR